MKWAISTAIDSIIANSFLSRMHISMGKSIIIIEKERLIRERSSQEKKNSSFFSMINNCNFLGRNKDKFLQDFTREFNDFSMKLVDFCLYSSFVSWISPGNWLFLPEISNFTQENFSMKQGKCLFLFISPLLISPIIHKDCKFCKASNLASTSGIYSMPFHTEFLAIHHGNIFV